MGGSINLGYRTTMAMTEIVEKVKLSQQFELIAATDYFFDVGWEVIEPLYQPMIELARDISLKIDSILDESGMDGDPDRFHGINGPYFCMVWPRAQLILAVSHEDHEIPILITLHHFPDP